MKHRAKSVVLLEWKKKVLRRSLFQDRERRYVNIIMLCSIPYLTWRTYAYRRGHCIVFCIYFGKLSYVWFYVRWQINILLHKVK